MILNSIDNNFYEVMEKLNKNIYYNLDKKEKSILSYLKIISKYNYTFLEDKLIENDIKKNKIIIISKILNDYKNYFIKKNENNFFNYNFKKSKNIKILKNINFYFEKKDDINDIEIKIIFNYIDNTKSIINIDILDLYKIKKQLSLVYINNYN